MKRHAFDQFEVLGTKRNHNDQWDEFIEVCWHLGFSVKVTGGVVLTHEINCSEEDFLIAIDLMWS